MGSKSLFKWPKQITNSLVEQLIKTERDIRRALLVFDSATAEYSNGFRHDHKTFGIMISRLITVNQFRLAEGLLERMKQEKCEVTEDIFLTMFRGYGRVHRPLDAMRVFLKMEDFQLRPSVKSYLTIMNILVEENHVKKALGFYREMRKTGILPSVVSLNILIKALCKSNETIDAALQIFREMPNRGCQPDSYTYGTLINGLCKLGKISQAKGLFDEMEQKEYAPSVVSYTNGKHREAVDVLDRMRLQGLKPSAGLYGKIIRGFCAECSYQEAANFIDEMVLGGIKPSRVTWSLHVRMHNMVIQGLCNSIDPP
ncbi:hypothetical protein PIB30_098125, partial [Stylosanthes scabra]|nr:hypothetical protein [Stylosanthes scabra]